MEIPFDNNTGEKYFLDVVTNEIETGDGVILVLNKKTCESFGKLFLELAKSNDYSHIHLGYEHNSPSGPGFRIELNEDL